MSCNRPPDSKRIFTVGATSSIFFEKMYYTYTIGRLFSFGLGLAPLGYCQSQKLTNIDYLGTGYDILTGNPHNHLYNPGYINLFNLFKKFNLSIIQRNYKYGYRMRHLCHHNYKKINEWFNSQKLLNISHVYFCQFGPHIFFN